MSGDLLLNKVSITYSSGDLGLAETTLTVREGTYLGVLGRSGSGKSTLLRLIAGAISSAGRSSAFGLISNATHAGTVKLGNKDITDLEPSRRDIRLLSQHGNLYPNLTVSQNIELMLDKRHHKSKVEELLQSFHLEHIANHYPEHISGGEMKRASLAKTIAVPAAVYLLDEPLAGIDRSLRFEMLGFLRKIKQTLRSSVIHVSHDPEVLTNIADRLCVIRSGRILQEGDLNTIVSKPIHPYVALEMEPFYRRHLRKIEKSARGFVANGVEFSGYTLPADTSSIVIDTRYLKFGIPDQASAWVAGYRGTEEIWHGTSQNCLVSVGRENEIWHIPGSMDSIVESDQLLVAKNALHFFDPKNRRLTPNE